MAIFGNKLAIAMILYSSNVGQSLDSAFKCFVVQLMISFKLLMDKYQVARLGNNEGKYESG